MLNQKIQYREKTSAKMLFKVSWFLKFFEIFLTVLLQNTKSGSVAVTLKICLFEIQGDILCPIHFRDSFVWNRKGNSMTVRDSFVWI